MKRWIPAGIVLPPLLLVATLSLAWAMYIISVVMGRSSLSDEAQIIMAIGGIGSLCTLMVQASVGVLGVRSGVRHKGDGWPWLGIAIALGSAAVGFGMLTVVWEMVMWYIAFEGGGGDWDAVVFYLQPTTCCISFPLVVLPAALGAVAFGLRGSSQS